jgi:hypothetical protein
MPPPAPHGWSLEGVEMCELVERLAEHAADALRCEAPRQGSNVFTIKPAPRRA